MLAERGGVRPAFEGRRAAHGGVGSVVDVEAADHEAERARDRRGVRSQGNAISAHPKNVSPVVETPAPIRWVLSVVLSFGLHVALVFVVFAAPTYAPGGEGGRSGGGGDTIEFGIVGLESEIAGDPVAALVVDPGEAEQGADQEIEDDTTPEPPRRDPDAIRVRPESPEEAPEAPREPEPRVEPRVDDRIAPAAEEPVDENAPETETEDPSEAARAVLLQAPGGATGAEETGSGRLPGEPGVPNDTIIAAAQGSSEEAREALLGRRGTFCEDPVAGTWVAQKFKMVGGRGRWVRFRLIVRRDGTQLTGRIVSRIWDGTASDHEPPECRPFISDMTWEMAGTGFVAGDQMTFRGGTARVIRSDCPSSGTYAPDAFSGTVDPERERFSSVNNDGAYDVNEPYVFRRVACE